MEKEKIYYLTKKGFEKIKREYEILQKIKAVKLKGDVPGVLESEELNPDYMVFQEDMDFIENRLTELEKTIKNAWIIKIPPKNKWNVVQLGAVVTLEVDKKNVDEIRILGTLEANPSLGIISNESPVGKALIGKKVGEEVVISSPIKTRYKIKKIRYEA